MTFETFEDQGGQAQAFPSVADLRPNESKVIMHTGLTVRDVFAMAALPAFIKLHATTGGNPVQAVADSYTTADLMVERRKTK